MSSSQENGDNRRMLLQCKAGTLPHYLQVAMVLLWRPLCTGHRTLVYRSSRVHWRVQ